MKRIGYLALFVAAAALAIATGGLTSWQLWLFALAPDRAFVVAGEGLQKCQINPRAAPAFIKG